MNKNRHYIFRYSFPEPIFIKAIFVKQTADLGIRGFCRVNSTFTKLQMNPIRIGLIGLGRMGGFFLEELRKSEKWEVASICDISPESRAWA